MAQLVKNLPKCRRPWFDSWVRKIHWRRDRLPTPVFLGFSCGSAGKESAHSVGDLGLIPGLGRSPGEGKGNLLQYSGLRIPWTVQSMGLQRVGYDWVTFTFYTPEWASYIRIYWWATSYHQFTAGEQGRCHITWMVIGPYGSKSLRI